MVIGITSRLETVETFLGADVLADFLEDSDVSLSCVAVFALLELGKKIEATEIFLGREVTDVFLEASDVATLRLR